VAAIEPPYFKKGDKDPDAGKPHRHTRNKIQLMLTGMAEKTENVSDDYQQMLEVLWVIAEKHPGEVLDAMIRVSGERF
jgi:hypothetical protein